MDDWYSVPPELVKAIRRAYVKAALTLQPVGLAGLWDAMRVELMRRPDGFGVFRGCPGERTGVEAVYWCLTVGAVPGLGVEVDPVERVIKVVKR